MADEKKLRTSMGAVETAKMLLMPVSQAIAWTVLRGELSGFGFEVPLTQRLVPVALFYGSWATIKRVYGDKNERGHVSMGALLVCLTTRNPALAALGCLGVIVNFSLVVPIVIGWPASKLAYVVKKTKLWAYVIKSYFASSLLFWSTAAYCLLRREAYYS